MSISIPITSFKGTPRTGHAARIVDVHAATELIIVAPNKVALERFMKRGTINYSERDVVPVVVNQVKEGG